MGNSISKKISAGLFSLFSSAVFKVRNENNASNLKYLRSYLRDKEIGLNQKDSSIIIVGKKELYKITIEKL